MIRLQRIGHILLLEILWERPNVKEIVRQGRGDNDKPIELEQPRG